MADIETISAGDGRLRLHTYQGWPFWQSEGIVKTANLLETLDDAEPWDVKNRNKVRELIPQLQHTITNLLTFGGVISSNGMLVEALDEYRELPRVMARLEEEWVIKLGAGWVMDRLGTDYLVTTSGERNPQPFNGNFYLVKPGIAGHMSADLINENQVGFRFDPESPLNIADRLHTLWDFPLKRFISYKETQLGIKPLHTNETYLIAAFLDVSHPLIGRIYRF